MNNNNNNEKKANLIFDKWKADLKGMNRSRHHVEENFDLLFSEMKRSNISFEIAHQILSKAIIEHYPSSSMVNYIYKTWKVADKNKNDFAEDWRQDIAAAAKRTFYSIYNIEGTTQKEEKTYGGMSAVEYRKQLQYAESFPLLDWTKIKHEPMTLEDFSDLQNLLTKDLEANDE